MSTKEFVFVSPLGTCKISLYYEDLVGSYQTLTSDINAAAVNDRPWPKAALDKMTSSNSSVDCTPRSEMPPTAKLT